MSKRSGSGKRRRAGPGRRGSSIPGDVPVFGPKFPRTMRGGFRR